MTRTEVTEMIIAAKRKKKLSYTEIAKKVGYSKEWTTAALLGQMTLNEKQAAIVGDLLSLPAEATTVCSKCTSQISCSSMINSQHERVGDKATQNHILAQLTRWNL